MGNKQGGLSPREGSQLRPIRNGEECGWHSPRTIIHCLLTLSSFTINSLPIVSILGPDSSTVHFLCLAEWCPSSEAADQPQYGQSDLGTYHTDKINYPVTSLRKYKPDNCHDPFEKITQDFQLHTMIGILYLAVYTLLPQVQPQKGLIKNHTQNLSTYRPVQSHPSQHICGDTLEKKYIQPQTVLFVCFVFVFAKKV